MIGDLWLPAEDKRLIAARALEMTWRQIAEFLPGRTHHACAKRFVTIQAQAARQKMRAAKPKPAAVSHVTVTPIEVAAEKLREATKRLYQREAERRGTSPDHVMLSMQFGPAAADLWQAQAA